MEVLVGELSARGARTRLIPEAIAAAHRAPALRRRQVPHLRVSQGKEQTVLGESALSRYSDLSLKAYSQSVSRRVGDRSLDRSNCVYSPFEGDYTTIKIVKETSTVIESHMGQ